jgi:membrane-associated HD superfamily phosphohydrolase
MFRSTSSLRIGAFVLAFALCAPFALGQMPQQGNSQSLSSSDISDEEIQKVASIAVSAQMATQEERMKMRKEMKQKYGNPQEMDSTQKAQARREMRKRQMAMQKKTMQAMRKEAKSEDMDPKRVQRILQSARQDKTLGKRLQKALKAEAKRQRGQQRMGGGNSGGNSGGSGGGR